MASGAITEVVGAGKALTTDIESKAQDAVSSVMGEIPVRALDNLPSNQLPSCSISHRLVNVFASWLTTPFGEISG